MKNSPDTPRVPVKFPVLSRYVPNRNNPEQDLLQI